MAIDLSRVGAREALKSRREPHWQRIRPGCYLGYRRSAREGSGTWIARGYDKDARSYKLKALGDFGELIAGERFTAARRAAEAFADMIESGGMPEEKIETVGDACRNYLKHRPGSIAAGVFRRHVYSDPISKVRLDKLRRHHLRDWRKRLEEAPALLSRNKEGDKRTKRRSASTVNRDMVPVRAALRAVLPQGSPGTDSAWQEALRPNRNADRRRGVYLDRNERQRLLAAADAEIEPLLRAMCVLPLRPGATAALTAGAFDRRTSTLTIGQDKAGGDRKIAVPPLIADFLMAHTKGKMPTAPMFSRSDGRVWNKDAWFEPIKDAAIAAGLPSGTSAYAVRHSVITDLVRDGLPILTVAQLSGTSVQMIEKHYGHLVRSDAVQALARLAV
jgi:site-specific recombinase XerD